MVRGPLKPLTPPLTVNKAELLSDLTARRFDALDARLKSYQEQAEHDITQEANAALAFETFTNNDPGLEPLLEEWVKKSPGSYPAHLAWAMLLFDQGWEARGGKFTSETTEQQFARMRDLFANGAHEAQGALVLDPKLSVAYTLLVQKQRADAGAEGCYQAGESALKRIPASYVIRTEVMRCLQPRWGGSYEAMDQFARESETFVHQNPRLAALKEFAALDRADLLYRKGEYVPAIAILTRAIAEGGDYAGFYRERARYLISLSRYPDAIQDLERADQLWPQYPPTLELLGYAMSQTGKNQEALSKLNQALQFGGPRPYEEQLRTSILMQLKRTSQGKAAAGGD
jgi:tetratricopeptide (TPR) repeat protein